MMAAAQPFISGAISRTVNMPNSVTAEDIAESYTWGWRMGLKALAIYRDGSKSSQPLNTSTEADKAAKKAVAAPRRERLPDTRNSVTHKFSVDGHEGYLCVGLYDDGRPGELFITMAKEGSTIGGMMDSFGTAVSMSLQYGVPLEVLVRKFSHTRFDPMGFTKNPDIRYAKSIVDYIFRWMGNQFIPGYREASLGLPVEGPAEKSGKDGTGGGDEETDRVPAARKAGGPVAGPRPAVQQSSAASGQGSVAGVSGRALAPGDSAAAPSAKTITAPVKVNGANGHANGHTKNGHNGNGHTLETAATRLARAGVAVKSDRPEVGTARSAQFAEFQKDAPLCDVCGAITVRNGNCYLCHGCGNSMGCS
jgi:ribonucleoside-diphosphate reductase alpha chain